MVLKHSIDTIQGEIMNVYCKCTASILASCNHVEGLLFHIEAAVSLSHTHQTSTSQLSHWNTLSHKKQIELVESS